jgi:Sigma-70, region 4
MRFGPEVRLSESQLSKCASHDLDPEAALMQSQRLRTSQLAQKALARACARQGLSLAARTEAPLPDRKLPPRVMTILSHFLPPEESYILTLHFLHEESQGEIARRLGVCPSAIQYRVHRALQRTRWALALESWDRTPAEISRDLGSVLSKSDVRLACALWQARWHHGKTARMLRCRLAVVNTRLMSLHHILQSHVDSTAIGPYARDLARVVKHKAWTIGSGQVQRGKRLPRVVRGMIK